MCRVKSCFGDQVAVIAASCKDEKAENKSGAYEFHGKLLSDVIVL
jgi:hypothetical protein